MARSRVKTAAKLFFLLGLPLLVAGGLFGAGVVCGVAHRQEVRRFEASLLGDDGRSTAPGSDQEDALEDTSSDTTTNEAGRRAESKPSGARRPSETPTLAESANPELLVVPVPWVVPLPTAARVPGDLDAREAPPVAVAEPVPADLRRSFDDRRVVTVKLLVGRTMIESHPAWVDEVQDLVASASATYEVLFGIELRLHGMVEWEADRKLADADALLADVRTRPREGADLLLAITDKPQVGGIGGRGDLPAAGSEVNGAYAVIFADGGDHPHLRTMLHEIGHIFGAVDIDDPGSEAFRRASWMSYAGVLEGVPPWIDEANRRTILERKSLPFVSAVAPPEPQEGPGR